MPQLPVPTNPPTCHPRLPRPATCAAPSRPGPAHLSAVPPPEARRLLWKGHHASALTAAQCACTLCSRLKDWSKMQRLLSLPPEASWCPHGDQRSPHTSCEGGGGGGAPGGEGGRHCHGQRQYHQSVCTHTCTPSLPAWMMPTRTCPDLRRLAPPVRTPRPAPTARPLPRRRRTCNAH